VVILIRDGMGGLEKREEEVTLSGIHHKRRYGRVKKREKMKKRRKRVRIGEGSVWRSQTKRGRWEGEVGEVNREGKKGRDWTRQKVWKNEKTKKKSTNR